MTESPEGPLFESRQQISTDYLQTGGFSSCRMSLRLFIMKSKPRQGITLPMGPGCVIGSLLCFGRNVLLLCFGSTFTHGPITRYATLAFALTTPVRPDGVTTWYAAVIPRSCFTPYLPVSGFVGQVRNMHERRRAVSEQERLHGSKFPWKSRDVCLNSQIFSLRQFTNKVWIAIQVINFDQSYPLYRWL